MSEAFQSLRGHLLLDAGGMYGSCFHHTVILMCRHSPEGAFGLVLNQPSEKRVGDALSLDLPLDVKQQPVRNGGPVEEDTVHILHSDAFMFQGNVLNNLSLVEDPSELSDIANSVNRITRSSFLPATPAGVRGSLRANWPARRGSFIQQALSWYSAIRTNQRGVTPFGR